MFLIKTTKNTGNCLKTPVLRIFKGKKREGKAET